MEMAKDLNMDSDEMQLVVSALRGVGKRIVEVAGTHNRSLQVSFSLRARKCASGCTSVPVPCRTIEIGRLFPTRSLRERYSIRFRTWRKC